MVFNPQNTANFLLGQRSRDAVLTDTLPEALRPPTLADAIAVQIASMRELGPVGGWKVGASDPSAEPVASPLPASGVKPSPVVVAARMRASECEISFRFGRTLPPRSPPYDRAEVEAAIESCQAAIEVVDPRYRSTEGHDALSILADMGMHGSLAVGKSVAKWDPEMFMTLGVIVAVDGVKRRELVGSMPGGSDLVRLLHWLANSEVARAFGGIQAGQVVTTGSWTGLMLSPPGAYVTARFAGFPAVEVRFGAC
ncbi:MAG: fumarylacetoacetate hydrolase [Rhodospirillales bacterium]|nr:fumarylacetoacetate hydrolase [Rhodospirillales bacterium]